MRTCHSISLESARTARKCERFSRKVFGALLSASAIGGRDDSGPEGPRPSSSVEGAEEEDSTSR